MFQQSDQVNSTIPKSFSVEKLQSVCYNFSPQFQKIYMGIILGNDYLEIHRGQHLERIMLNDHLTFQILRFHPLQNPHQHSNLNPKFANKNKNTLGNACGLKFQFLNEDKAIQFYFENSDEANLWINKLQNRMNQLNFNREIHIIKKIKNGVQATFYYGQRVQTRERVLVKAYSKERMISENTYENFLQEISTMRIFVQKNWLKFYIIFQSNQAYYILMEEIFANQMISSCNIGSLRGISQNLSSSVSLQNDLNCVAQQLNDIRRQNLRENLSLGRKKSGFQKSTKSFQSIKQHQPLRKLVN